MQKKVFFTIEFSYSYFYYRNFDKIINKLIKLCNCESEIHTYPTTTLTVTMKQFSQWDSLLNDLSKPNKY